MLSHKIGLIGNAQVIYIDVSTICITAPAQFAALILPLFHSEQQFSKLRNQRQRPTAGFIFGAILRDYFHLPFGAKLHNSMVDHNCISGKVYGLPPKAHNLTTPQSVKCCHKNRKFDRVSFGAFEKFIHFFERIEGANKLTAFRPIYFFHRVCRDQVVSDRIL